MVATFPFMNMILSCFIRKYILKQKLDFLTRMQIGCARNYTKHLMRGNMSYYELLFIWKSIFYYCHHCYISLTNFIFETFCWNNHSEQMSHAYHCVKCNTILQITSSTTNGRAEGIILRGVQSSFFVFIFRKLISMENIHLHFIINKTYDFHRLTFGFKFCCNKFCTGFNYQ